jgi:hypothetical protein
MDNKRGFITVATGNYYCWLAENLVMSYKLFSDTKYPMYVMTDKKGEKRLKKYFDGVVVLDKPYYTFMDKMTVYQNSPFEETVFLDADMDIVNDISYVFDEFEKNGSDVSCIGTLRRIQDDAKPNHFGNAAVEHFGLDSYISFGGGIYYYKKGEIIDKLFDFINNDLIPNYDKYELKRFRNGQMADEPLMGLAMLVMKQRPLTLPIHIMRFHNNMMESFRWDMNLRECSFLWRDNQLVSPSIAHYGTHNTYHKKYAYYNSLLRCKYHKVFPIFIPFHILGSEVQLLCRHIAIPSDRAAFWNWFRSHFTKAHLHYRKEQLVSLFKRG